MTFLLGRLERWLPPRPAACVLVFIYAATLVGVVLCLGLEPPDLIYLDVRGGR